MSKINFSSTNEGMSISNQLEKLQIKHLFLPNNQIIALGRMGTIKVKGEIIEPTIFSTYSPKENLKFVASLCKEMPEAIDRLIDLSKSIESKSDLENIKRLIKSGNTFYYEFLALIKRLASNSP